MNYNILLKKLEHYGIRGDALSCFTSYLSHRNQFLAVDGTSLSTSNITCGASQGSLLDPLLFLVYKYDLPCSSKKLKFLLFADDTYIFFESDNPNKLVSKVNKGLCKVKSWLDCNKRAINIDKTHLFFIPLGKHYLT